MEAGWQRMPDLSILKKMTPIKCFVSTVYIHMAYIKRKPTINPEPWTLNLNPKP